MERYLCVHGHFYQPPRENPWIEAVEIQDGAYPYHDWNERITAECYSPNATSRILDDKKRIVEIISNYSRMSFDVGPTLLSWLQRNDPETYEAVVDADRAGAERNSGHGPAVCQAYNHMIMPLASLRDKRTQVLWGIGDFRHRFGRPPEGIWLPETAVDIETLDIAASEGIKFTVLAPHQAKRIRRKGGSSWEDVSGGRIDSTRAYLLNLPSGRAIAVFFYDSPISHAVAFEGLLENGEKFAKRFIGGYNDKRTWGQLMHIATDGESYGHHHRFGDMALAFALDYTEKKGLAKVTNYAAYLEKQPPAYDVEIFENTSWSCSHGVERWRGDCGCNSGASPGWNQKWRAPLRSALDWLRDELSGGYEKAASEFFKDPWAARDAYVKVVLDRSDESINGFFGENASRQLGKDEMTKALKLLEMQRHAMLMYTSCGWFFDDISGIETIQILQYAGRAVQLSRDLFGNGIEEGFRQRLKAAKSNSPEHGDGASIYDRHVKPAVTDIRKVCVHYGVSSLFEDYPDRTKIYCYDVERLDYGKTAAGRAQLLTGKCVITSDITKESETMCYCVLHLGNHDFNCGVHRFEGDEQKARISGEMISAFESGSFTEVVRLMDTHFGMHSYSLKDLFKDEQRKILDTLLKETLDEFEASYRRIYEENRILMGFLGENGIPIPRSFYTAAEFILNLDIKKELGGNLDVAKMKTLLEQSKEWKAKLDDIGLEFALRNTLIAKMKAFHDDPADALRLEMLEKTIEVTRLMPFTVNTWVPQNIYYNMARNVYPAYTAKAGTADWADRFKAIGEKLNFNLARLLG